MPSSTPSSDSALIAALIELAKRDKKLVKSNAYAAPADPSVTVLSWKMNEYKYNQVPSPFPTLARGLFTSGERIVVRGYDKFFNIGEVPWTTWKEIEAHTAPPYTLSLKANGCIIFIAALTQNTLLITSKHSLGPSTQDTGKESHAQVGERWLRKHLESKGKTTELLAGTLWERNLTAIAELCDDSFEEHVLPYSPEKSGLHLHGLNLTGCAFATLPAAEVDAFADAWGFVRTPTIDLGSVAEVRAFTDEVGRTGKWDGEAVEGFVVRTHVASRPNADIANTERPMTPTGARSGAPPYPPGSTFFFKIKFDEPYKMYRDWRELTKMLLSKGAAAKLPNGMTRRPETSAYVAWVKKEIKRDPAAFKGYTKGQGIIAVRERFLKWMGEKGKEGKEMDAVADALAALDVQEPLSKTLSSAEGVKTIIVTVGVPGCGKTTVSVALAKLFGFGHTQSDDVKAKKAAPVFVRNVLALLKTHNVVIADRNNHLRQHRTALRDAAASRHPPVQLLALDWSRSITALPGAEAHRVCAERIVRRGDAHQSLRADTSRRHERVVDFFLDGLEPLDAAHEVDGCVSMELPVHGEAGEAALGAAVRQVAEALGLEMPDAARVREAWDAAQAYRPTVTVKRGREQPERARPPRYFGLVPDVDLEAVLQDAWAGEAPPPPLWTHLQETRRVKTAPHVTIVHKNGLPEERDVWDGCEALVRLVPPPVYVFRLAAAVWDDQAMAVAVDMLRLEGEEEAGREEEGEGVAQRRDAEGGPEMADAARWSLERLPSHVKARLHITVGTREGVPDVAAMKLVEEWRSGHSAEAHGIHSYPLHGVLARGQLKGLIQ